MKLYEHSNVLVIKIVIGGNVVLINSKMNQDMTLIERREESY